MKFGVSEMIIAFLIYYLGLLALDETPVSIFDYMIQSGAPRQDIVSILFPSKETEQYQLSILPFLTF